MTPEDIAACAERAYEIMAANTGETTPWAKVGTKLAWIDAVTAHMHHPEAIQRKTEPNMQERCVLQAYREMYAPAAKAPLVIPADTKTKGGKSK